jgi:hypothetical protein
MQESICKKRGEKEMEKPYEEMYRHIDSITKNKKYTYQYYKKAKAQLKKKLS